MTESTTATDGDAAPETWLPVRAPQVTSETQPFWDGTAEGRIDLAQCSACGLIPWYPRAVCPDCQGTEFSWKTMAGTGTVYSFSVTRAGGGRAWKPHLPFVVAYVELDEGPRLLTNLVDCDPDQVTIGMEVTAVFEPTAEGPALIRFRPASAS